VNAARTAEASRTWVFLFRAELSGPLWRQARVAVAVAGPEPESEAYRQAVTSCRAALAPVVAGWEAQVARRRTLEAQELERFYRQCLTEEVTGLGRLFHRVAVLEVRVHLAKKPGARRQFRQELRRSVGELAGELGGKEERAGGLAAELARRQEELAVRYAGEVRVELVGIRRADGQALADDPVGEE
jgi:hypothetical protein